MKRKTSQLPELKKNKKGEFYINFQYKKVYMGRNKETAEKRLKAFILKTMIENEDNDLVERMKMKNVQKSIDLPTLILKYIQFQEKNNYGNIGRVLIALRRVHELFPEIQAENFGPLAFRMVRQSWVKDGKSDTYIKDLCSIVTNMFRWAAEFELLEEECYRKIKLVSPLKPGEAKTNPPREAVDDETIIKTLPYLKPIVKDMVVLQRLTGMRPSEMLRMSQDQIDMSRDVWIYCPKKHKTLLKGKVRIIPLGKPEQDILKKYFTGKPEQLLFTIKNHPFVKNHYHYYVKKAIDYANKNGMEIKHWTPYQLRHASATFISLLFGIDSASVQLGHASTSMTERYDHSNIQKAVQLIQARDQQYGDILKKFE